MRGEFCLLTKSQIRHKMSGPCSILPPSFGNANVVAKQNQSDWCDRSRQCEDQPHCARIPRSVFWNKRSQQPSTGPDKEFTNEEREVGQRTVGSFLSWRGNRGSILVHPRRIERL